MKSQTKPISNGCTKESYPKLITTSEVENADLNLTTEEFTCNEAGTNPSKKSLTNCTKNEEHPYECKTCDQFFTRSDYYLTHQRKHKDSKSKKTVKTYSCNICHKAFTYRHVLKRHVAMHSNKLNFACNNCDAKFNRKDYLLAHIRISHSVKNPFECKFCKNVFRHKKSLVIHIRRHTGENPYACRYCDKKFTRKDYMLQHQLLHELRNTTLVCAYCEKVFKKKNLLEKHIQEHTGKEKTKRLDSARPVITQDTEQVFIDSNSCDIEFYDELEIDCDEISDTEEMVVDAMETGKACRSSEILKLKHVRMKTLGDDFSLKDNICMKCFQYGQLVQLVQLPVIAMLLFRSNFSYFFLLSHFLNFQSMYSSMKIAHF